MKAIDSNTPGAAFREVAATLLAVQLSGVVRRWLTPEELDAVRKANAADPEEPEATYDYCDANMAMLEAAESLGIDFPTALESTDRRVEEEACNLWNRAWEIARFIGFAEPTTRG